MPAARTLASRIACILAVVIVLGLVPAVSAQIVLPDNTKIEKVDFERHLMGLFGKAGCAAASCHGSFQGKGGLRLSLFGYDPEKDYSALTRESLGRRINPVNPDQSLLLLKATGQVEHGGGKRFSVGSWQYLMFRQWIADGAAWRKGSGDVASVTINPPEQAFKKPGESSQLVVKAKYKDGSQENITSLSSFRVNDDAVAEVSPDGLVKALQPGDTALVVTYRGNVLSLRALVPMENTATFNVPEVNYVDGLVFAKLRRLNMAPAELSNDTEFLRRVTLDTIGCLPTPDEARAFLADKDPQKRAKKIDELLTHPMHAALWATKFCDITGNDTDSLEQPVQIRPKLSQMWHDWFRKRLAANVPYDQIVKGVLTATSREGKNPEEWIEVVKEIDEQSAKGFETKYADRETLDLYWRRQAVITFEQWGERTAAAFLGIRLECAQCHKHPLDRWTQADYRSYANIFTQVNFGVSAEAKAAIDAENKARGVVAKANNNKAKIGPVREVFVGTPKAALTHPDTGERLSAKALGGPEIKTEGGKDQRAALVDWLVTPDNPFFARSFVNRIWGHYFGMGIVHPVDDFSQANPPSNEKLLDSLAKDFVARKFDIRHIERTILNSRTYQLASAGNASNKFDRTNYAKSYVRPLMAEVVVDLLNSALGTTENLGTDAPPNARAIEVGASRVQNPYVAHMFRIFGRPPRTTACDCERALEPALPQTLFRLTDPQLLAKISAPSGRLRTLLASTKTDDEILDELCLATVTRLPTEKERLGFAEYRKGKDRQAAFIDLVWALLNTKEFFLNH